MGSPYTSADRAEFLLPGQVGGAEMLDTRMAQHLTAQGHTVTMLHPDQWEEALDADRVIVTRLEGIPDEGCDMLTRCTPVVWVHHLQQPTAGHVRLIRAADPFVVMSDAHAMREVWGPTPVVCNGWLDLSEIPWGEGDGTALWAARNHPQKGLFFSRVYAQSRGWTLVEAMNVPRGELLQMMARASYFLFHPKGFDACPRTLIEAEAAGCEIHTNALAGRREPGPLREVNDEQLRRFLSWF